MIDIAIQATPNQSLTIQLETYRYDILLKEANGIMTASFVRDGVTLVDGVRLVSGTPALPYDYMEAAGNFVLNTEDYALPYYLEFGVTQFLVYLTADEVAALRA